MLNPFRKSAKPFDEMAPDPAPRKYPNILIGDETRRVVMIGDNKFVIERMHASKDALGQPVSYWYQEYEINSTVTFPREVKVETVLWLLSRLAAE